MKKSTKLYLSLIGMKLAQGLQKISIVVLGILLAVTTIKTLVKYFDANIFPSTWSIVIIVFSIIAIIVLLTLKKLIDDKLEEINAGIKDYKALKNYSKKIKTEYEYRATENKIKQESENNEAEELAINKFEVEKIDKSDIKKLDSLIGLTAVKLQIAKMRATMDYERKHGGNGNSTMHLRFSGAPGTGKTTVAKCMAAILYDAGVIPKAQYISVNGNDLMGMYTGTTSKVVNALFKKGKGGVIFIDEAYALADAATNIQGGGYGFEAVNQLLTHLENRDSKTVVIFGGYDYKLKQFFEMNPGFASRVPITINFPDYTPNELLQILELNLKIYNHKLTEEVKPQLELLFQRKIQFCKNTRRPFSNGRYARNVCDELHTAHALNYSRDNSIGTDIIPMDIDIETLFHLD